MCPLGLIILGQNSNELYREAIETKSESVSEVFQQYHYPWVDKDLSLNTI